MGREKFKVYEGVFDDYTLNTLERLKRKKYFDELGKIIKPGKEADIYVGIRESVSGDKGDNVGLGDSGSGDIGDMGRSGVSDVSNNYFAIKIFRMTSANFKKISQYIQRDYRFKSIKGDKRKVILKWSQKEFRNLLKCYKEGINVPYPYTQLNNVIIMEYIDGNMLKDTLLENPQEFFDDLLDQLNLLRHNAQLIHGDLSSYNIMVRDQMPIIIDLGQAMSIKNDDDFNEYYDLYSRDVENIVNYFNKYHNLGVSVEEVFKKLDEPLYKSN